MFDAVGPVDNFVGRSNGLALMDSDEQKHPLNERADAVDDSRPRTGPLPILDKFADNAGADVSIVVSGSRSGSSDGWDGRQLGDSIGALQHNETSEYKISGRG